MDKAGYIKRWPLERLCQGGRLPLHGAVIDESSGSSGQASNWVRGPSERAAARRLLQFATRAAFGDEPFVLLNAFALGPWATGMNVSMSLVDLCVLKSIGPDAAKLIGTLEAARPQVQIRDHRLPAVPEGTGRHRRHRLVGVRRVRRGRRGRDVAAAARRAEQALSQDDLELRRVRPRDQHRRRDRFHDRAARRARVEPVARRSVVRPRAVADGLPVRPAQLLHRERRRPESSRHDQSAGERVAANPLQHPRSGGRPAGATKSSQPPLVSAWICPRPLVDLPLLFHWGRQDNAVGFYGCKITPEDIQHVILRVGALGERVTNFALHPYEDADANKRVEIWFELASDAELPDAERLRGVRADRTGRGKPGFPRIDQDGPRRAATRR